MEGSKHRYLATARTAVAGALLAGAVAVAGCGGGGGSDKTTAPPTPAGSAGSGGVVTAEGTQGLVGPASRSTDKGSSGFDKTTDIPGSANHAVRGKKGGKNGVGAP